MKRTAKRSLRIGVAGLLSVAGLLGPAAVARAGDPVPDVDVILEQIPGGRIAVHVLPPVSVAGDPIPDVDVILEQLPGFDAVRLSGDKSLKDLAIVGLPAGWGMRRDGKRLVLSGPTAVPPVRFQLEVRGARPERVNVELLRGDEVRFSRMKIRPRIVPQRVVAGTLTGTVRLPPRVSPGETVALRPLAGSTLPPGGRWVIGGTVSEPWDEEDLSHARTIVNTTRSNIKTRLAEATPADRRPLVFLGDGGCEALAPVAAVLWARGDGAAGGAPLAVSELQAGDGGQAEGGVFLADLSPATLHDVAMGSIRNLRLFFTASEEPPPGIAINEEEDLIAARPGSPAAVQPPKGDRKTGKQEAWTAAAATASHAAVWTWTDPWPLADLEPDRPQLVALEGEAMAGGCRFLRRQPDDLDLARWARQQAPKTSRPSGKPPATEIHLLTLPQNLRPGEPLSARYLDEWGDPWIEVAAVPDVEVVPPRPAAAAGTLDGASPYAVAGDQVCVCGAFSALDAVARFSLASRPVEVIAISERVAWLQSTPDLLGPALIQTEGFRGEAATELVELRAELDQEHLFSGQSTPLRITVLGSEASLPIRIYNGSPREIELEGGADQTTESSGGAVNQVVRQVRGLERGSFELTWELVSPACPCAEPGG